MCIVPADLTAGVRAVGLVPFDCARQGYQNVLHI